MGQVIEAQITQMQALDTVAYEQPPSEQRQKTYDAWKREWDALTDEISAVWNTDQSATELVSETRR